MSDDSTNQELHGKAKKGMKLLIGRQAVLQILTFAGGVVLARKLGPGPVGLYIIANFLVGMFALLGDFGIAPSFIQRKADLTDRDLQVGFSVQQFLTTGIVLVLFALAPWLAHFYPKAPPATVWLVRALSLNLFLTSWRSMSALQLERHLRYDRLARIEVLEALVYQGVAVCMALTSHGTWSFVAAVLASGITGTVLVYWAAPWRIRLAFDKATAMELLKFGIPFQLQAIASSINGWAAPLVVGNLVGPQGVGFLTWASSNGKKPTILVDNVMRVAFPHFSRIQEDRAEIERVLIRYLTYLLLPSGLWLSVLCVAGHPLVLWIYTAKWVPAVPALILYASSLLTDVISWVAAVTVNSIGRVNFTTRVVLVRSLMTFGLSLPAVHVFGFKGVPMAFLTSSIVTVPWMLSGLGQGVCSRVLVQIAWIAIPILAAIGVGEVISRVPLVPVAEALLCSLATGLAYCLGLWIAAPGWIKTQALDKIASRIAVRVAAT